MFAPQGCSVHTLDSNAHILGDSACILGGSAGILSGRSYQGLCSSGYGVLMHVLFEVPVTQDAAHLSFSCGAPSYS